MKLVSLIAIFFIFGFSTQGVFAQCDIPGSVTQANVSTPKGSSVTAYITPENTNYWREYYDAYFVKSGRNYMYYFGDGFSSSRRFNFHGFAWHMD